MIRLPGGGAAFALGGQVDEQRYMDELRAEHTGRIRREARLRMTPAPQAPADDDAAGWALLAAELTRALQ